MKRKRVCRKLPLNIFNPSVYYLYSSFAVVTSQTDYPILTIMNLKEKTELNLQLSINVKLELAGEIRVYMNFILRMNTHRYVWYSCMCFNTF